MREIRTSLEGFAGLHLDSVYMRNNELHNVQLTGQNRSIIILIRNITCRPDSDDTYSVTNRNTIRMLT